MAQNTYKTIHDAPFVRSLDVGGETKDKVIVFLQFIVTANAEDGYGSHLDAKLVLPEPDPALFIDFEDITLEWITEITDKYILENNWHEALDKKIEANRALPLKHPFAWQQAAPSE